MISFSQTNQIKAADPVSSVWVSASAGTGKTRVLVNRILRLLLAGNAPEKLLCITYTKPAAAEILDRISHITTIWATSNDDDLQNDLYKLLDRTPHGHERTAARTLLPKILQASGGMRIMTIHAFCQSVLSRFPLEAGINGNFEICDDLQSHALLARAKQNLLLRTSADSNPELFQALAFLYDWISEDVQDSLITSVIKKRHKLDILAKRFGGVKGFESYKSYLADQIGISPDTTLKSLNDTFLSGIPHAKLRGFADILLSCKAATPRKTGKNILDFIKTPTCEAYCDVFLTDKNTITKLLLSGIDPNQTELIAFLESEALRAFEYKQALCSLDLLMCSTSLYLCCISLLDEYKKLKRAANLLDYEDQILLTEKLLTELSNCQWVLYKLDAGIDHLLLDEAQDTSPSQWNIVDKLVDEFFETPGNGQSPPRTIFVVGDEKQSIFSFQNADPESFSVMKERFKEKAGIKQHPYDDLSLIENYRSSSVILDFVDTIFQDEDLRSRISHLDEPIKHEAHYQDYPGQIDIWPLVPVIEDKKSDYILAQEVATHVKNLLDAETYITENKKLVRLKPGHIMILVRERNPMVNPLVKAFKDLNIQVRSVDRILLSDQLVVQDCLTALSVCLNPFDDYALACFLKSPFIGLSEQDLYDLTFKRPNSLWDNLTASSVPLIQQIVSYYKHLLQAAEDNIPYHFFHILLSHPCPANTHSGKNALIRRLGYDVEDVLDQFLDTVISYQQKNTFSNQGFTTWFLHSAATTKSHNAGTDETHVRIMTVHGSKGLQAPIVYMVDSNSKTKGYGSTRNVLWRKSDDIFLWAMQPGSTHPLFTAEAAELLNDNFDEYYRLLYVALTRAQERLIICGCDRKRNSNKEFKSWYEIASEAISSANHPVSTFSILKQDGLSIVKQAKIKLPQIDESRTTNALSFRDDLMDKPAPEPLPYFPLRPSQLPGKAQAVFSPLSTSGSGNFLRGEILHKLFSVASRFDKLEQPIILNRILENYTMNAVQSAELYNEAWSILSDNRFANLFSSQSRAEVPITGQITLDETLYNVNGQIDRLLVEQDRVLIVDFKTNRPASMTEEDVSEHYKFQLQAYKMILSQIYPDKKIETAILWTSVPYLLPLSL